MGLAKYIKKYTFALKNKGIKRANKAALYKLESIVCKKYLKIKSKKSSNIIKNPYEIILVPVDAIEDMYIYNESNKVKLNMRKWRFIFFNCRMSGLIMDGDWDLNNNKKFSKYDIYKAFKERFIQNKSWEDTLYFDIFHDRLQKNGEGRGGIKTFKCLKDNYLLKWDELYDEIKRNGYKSQLELNNGNLTNEIQILVARDGNILFRDGRHRLSIAKILGLKKVPVIVNVWHKEYIDWIKDNTDIDKITPKTAIKPILDGRKIYG